MARMLQLGGAVGNGDVAERRQCVTSGATAVAIPLS
jgi:hypothetical protein